MSCAHTTRSTEKKRYTLQCQFVITLLGLYNSATRQRSATAAAPALTETDATEVDDDHLIVTVTYNNDVVTSPRLSFTFSKSNSSNLIHGQNFSQQVKLLTSKLHINLSLSSVKL